MFRYPMPVELAGLARLFWIPVWSVPAGQEAAQPVLRYPVALIVITEEYARFYGPVAGLHTTVLAGSGWAAGVMLQPAAGTLISGTPMVRWTDRHDDVSAVLGEAGKSLTADVRAAMSANPSSEDSHRAAMAALAAVLHRKLPVDAEGLMINDIVAFIEEHSDVMRVSQVCDKFAIPARSLQRLTRSRVGLSTKWIIQRRRLHEASERLRNGADDLGVTATELGYADQAHLTRDFRTVTGMTPRVFAARYGAT